MGNNFWSNVTRGRNVDLESLVIVDDVIVVVLLLVDVLLLDVVVLTPLKALIEEEESIEDEEGTLFPHAPKPDSISSGSGGTSAQK